MYNVCMTSKIEASYSHHCFVHVKSIFFAEIRVLRRIQNFSTSVHNLIHIQYINLKRIDHFGKQYISYGRLMFYFTFKLIYKCGLSSNVKFIGRTRSACTKSSTYLRQILRKRTHSKYLADSCSLFNVFHLKVCLILSIKSKHSES